MELVTTDACANDPQRTKTPRRLTSTNPANGLVLMDYACMGPEEIERAVESAARGQRGWARTDRTERSEMLRATADRLRSDRDKLAMLVAQEMGKPLREALAEIDKCAWVCDYYAEESPRALAATPVEASGSRSWTSYEPLGVLLAVMPWNFPFWQVFRVAAPSLAAGNACLVKHAPNVTGCALAIEQTFRAAGLPEGLLTALVVDESEVPTTVARLISDPRVSAVTVTGSGQAGAQVGAAAGRAIKKSVLELGGSDPFVVLQGADVDFVVPKAVSSRFLNNGQSCLAAKRFLVHRSLLDDFAEKLAVAVQGLVVGEPLDEETTIGPLARADLVDTLDRQVRSSIAQGARLLTGGAPIKRAGSWYAPTVLADVTPQMAVMREETFGPVAVVIGFDSDEEAVHLANRTPYGLGASVWSPDEAQALAVGARIHSGALFVNAVVASDPRLPFGGVKDSGYGRELGTAGAREFTNVRTIVVG